MLAGLQAWHATAPPVLTSFLQMQHIYPRTAPDLQVLENQLRPGFENLCCLVHGDHALIVLQVLVHVLNKPMYGHTECRDAQRVHPCLQRLAPCQAL